MLAAGCAGAGYPGRLSLREHRRHRGQVSWALPETTIVLPLLAEALATTGTVPEAPVAHCPVTVPVPVREETTVAIVELVGLSTTNCPE